MSEPTIAEAVGTAVGGKSEFSRGGAVRAAMDAAVEQAIAEGVTDANEIRRRKMEARDAARRIHRTNTVAEGQLG